MLQHSRIHHHNQEIFVEASLGNCTDVRPETQWRTTTAVVRRAVCELAGVQRAEATGAPGASVLSSVGRFPGATSRSPVLCTGSAAADARRRQRRVPGTLQGAVRGQLLPTPSRAVWLASASPFASSGVSRHRAGHPADGRPPGTNSAQVGGRAAVSRFTRFVYAECGLRQSHTRQLASLGWVLSLVVHFVV